MLPFKQQDYFCIDTVNLWRTTLCHIFSPISFCSIKLPSNKTQNNFILLMNLVEQIRDQSAERMQLSLMRDNLMLRRGQQQSRL